MRKLLTLTASLMLVLTLWSGIHASVASAAEYSSCATALEGTPPGHTPGDADEVPSDSDKATPHHHNLGHSHEIGVPAREWTAALMPPVIQPGVRAAVSPPTAFAPHRDLRPPIA